VSAGPPDRRLWHHPRMVDAALDAPNRTVARPSLHRVPRRPVSVGLLTAVAACACAGAAWLGRDPLAGALFVVQVLLVLAWLAALDPAGSFGAFLVAVAAAAAGDAIGTVGAEVSLRRLAVIIGVLPLAALLHQLLRRSRAGAVGSLAGAVSAGLLVLAMVPLLSLRAGRGGREAVVAGLIGVAAALPVARITDAILPWPALTTGGARGWAGLLTGVAAAAGAGAGFGTVAAPLTVTGSLRLAAVSGAVGLAAELAVHLAGLAMRTGDRADARQLSAVPPLAALLPVVVCGPAVYVAGRLLLG
jgi:hypothetical protein